MKFIEKRKIWYTASLVIIVAGIVSLFIQGLNWGIDFAGGNLAQIQFTEKIETSTLRADISELGYANTNIQVSEDNVFILKTPLMDEAEQELMLDKIKEKTGELEILRTEKVGPAVGKELQRAGLISLAVALILMLIYISIRFELRFAIAGIIALFHDIMVIVGFFSIFQIEVNSSFVAAILTVFGYSINDTIVIFDRIRENMKNSGKVKSKDLPELINSSLMQTMTRSINTSLTTLIVLVALFIFGGETTKDFVLALIVGIVNGAYSSIFTASPIWYDLKRKSELKNA